MATHERNDVDCREPTDKTQGGPLAIDHYSVERRLAVGTMGEIYLAYEPGLDRRVALKFLGPEFCRNPKNVERFVREAKASADLQHSNIVSVYYSGEYKGRPYFAMEWVDGESLAEVAIRGPLEPLVAVEYMIQAARGLDAAWKKGIIHRDVKPANLMLNKRGTVKVADFGLAKSIGKETGLTSTDIVVGTPDFIAPEQAKGEACDCRADIYSLGASFFFLLTSTVPFPGPNSAAVLVKHITDPVPSITDHRPNLPGSLARSIKKMMAKSPKDRFQTYGELITHLDKLKERMAAGLDDSSVDPLSRARPLGQSRQLQRAKVPDTSTSLGAKLFLGFLGLLFVAGVVCHVLAPPWWPIAGLGTARVVCSTRPLGAEILVDGTPVGRTADGETSFVVRSGERSFEFRLPNHRARVVTFDVRSGQDNEVGPVELEPHWGQLRINGTPPDSEVRMTSMADPKAPEKRIRFGGLVPKLAAGRYVLEAEEDRHSPQKRSVEIPGDGSVVEVEFKLEPLRTAVRVASAPPGAAVQWDGTALGRQTPCELTDVTMGTHELRLDFVEDGRRLFWQGTVDVGPGAPFVVERPLVPWTVPVTFASVPPGARIEQRQPPLELAMLGFAKPLEKRFPPGVYVFAFSHPGYRTETRRVDVRGDDPIAVHVDLLEQTGRLVFDVVPRDAVVTVDGRVLTPAERAELPVIPGDYVVTGSHAKHYTTTRTVTVADGQTTRVELHLRQHIPGPEPGRDFMNGVGMQMSWLKPGTFVMGSPLRERGRQLNEGPQHTVELSRPFWMGTYEVTQDEYQAVMGRNPASFKGARRPVENVTWNDATAFCQELTTLERQAGRIGRGQVYRLPSESEWEYACRAGSTEAFAFGPSLSSEQANFDGNYPYGQAARGVYRERTTTVGLFKPNAFGLYDMHGNVFEWCADVWHDTYDKAPPDGRAWIEGTDTGRVVRGGSWGTNAESCRSARRTRSAPDQAYHSYGLRVVLTMPEGVPWPLPRDN